MTVWRIYTWEVRVPEDRLIHDLREQMAAAGARVEQFNPRVKELTVQESGDKIHVSIHFGARDQWDIKRHIVHALLPLLVKNRVPQDLVKLIRVERPPSGAATRLRASDGQHKPIPDDQDIDHSDMGLVMQ